MNLRSKDQPSVAAAKASISTATAYRIESLARADGPILWRASSMKRSFRCWSTRPICAR